MNRSCSCLRGRIQFGNHVTPVQDSPVHEPFQPVCRELRERVSVDADHAKDAERQRNQAQDDNPQRQGERHPEDRNGGQEHKNDCLYRVPDPDHAPEKPSGRQEVRRDVVDVLFFVVVCHCRFLSMRVPSVYCSVQEQGALFSDA